MATITSDHETSALIRYGIPGTIMFGTFFFFVAIEQLVGFTLEGAGTQKSSTAPQCIVPFSRVCGSRDGGISTGGFDSNWLHNLSALLLQLVVVGPSRTSARSGQDAFL